MKWAIPKALSILGIWHVVEIRPFTEDEINSVGLYDSNDRSIHISSVLPEHLRYEVFCHEVSEAISSMLDLNLKHYQISGMGMGFHDVFRNQLCAGEEQD